MHHHPITEDKYNTLEQFVQHCGHEGVITFCAKDMSNRVYYRVQTQMTSYIIMEAPPSEQPERFIALSEFLAQHGLTSPSVYCYDDKKHLALLQDFGDQTFTKLLSLSPESEEILYCNAISVLKVLHKAPKPGFIETYDTEKLMAEVEIFIAWYWPYIKGNKSPEITKSAFIQIWKDLFEHMPQTPQTLVLRDYHCDNLMSIDDTPPHLLTVRTCGILDFQDALWGSVAYDFISLVEDARRTVSPHVIAKCTEHFFEKFSEDEIASIQQAGKILAMGRHLKVLGVFARYALRNNNPSKCVHNQRIWGYITSLMTDPLFHDLKDWMKINFPFEK